MHFRCGGGCGFWRRLKILEQLPFEDYIEVSIGSNFKKKLAWMVRPMTVKMLPLSQRFRMLNEFKIFVQVNFFFEQMPFDR